MQKSVHNILTSTGLLLAVSIATSTSLANDFKMQKSVDTEPIILAQAVVPKEEEARAQKLLADGPTKTTGILGVKLLNTVSLDGEFKSSDGLVLRVRELAIEPDGVVAVHQHDNRPGTAYIIEGEMTEYRSSEAGPVAKKAGEVAMERSGVIHWWKNTGKVTARALVVDIVKSK